MKIAVPNHRLNVWGNFWGIISQDASFSKSTWFHVDILQVFFSKRENYFMKFPKRISTLDMVFSVMWYVM